MRFELKKSMINDYKSYQYLLKIYNNIPYCKDKEIVLDFFRTQRFESNLIAILYLIIDFASGYGRTVSFFMPDNKIYVGYEGAYKCFNYYANKSHRKSFFKPRCIIGNPNKKEIEDVLTKFLYELELLEQSKISIMISELIANIKMHVINNNVDCKGFMCSAVTPDNKDLYITIINNGKSIRNILKDNRMEFTSDVDAIIWALRKSNSTRKDDEAGGLGLYLLRKYISELNGDITICSGYEIILLENGGYLFEDEDNNKGMNKSERLSVEFDGTLITLRIPYKKRIACDNTGSENEKYTDIVNIYRG